MIAAQRILCPVDLSECSRRALQVAASLARRADARVIVLHVGTTVSLYPALVVQVDAVQVPHPTRAERAADVARFIAPVSDPHRPMDILLEEGDVAALIAAAAVEHAVDLIVMGTHGRRGFRRLAMGSIARRVVHTANCPVLVVPPEPARLPTLEGFERIVCRGAALDLAYARACAFDPGSHVEAVPAGLPAAALLDAAALARADLIVWNRASHPVDDIIAQAAAPVLVVHDTVPPSWQCAPPAHREPRRDCPADQCGHSASP
jgi:universal stress protein A